MTRSTYVFTSESVSEGHPDKVCDRISDAVLDAFLAEEPEARVACETFATTNRVVIGGEVGLSDKEKLSSYMLAAAARPHDRAVLPGGDHQIDAPERLDENGPVRLVVVLGESFEDRGRRRRRSDVLRNGDGAGIRHVSMVARRRGASTRRRTAGR